MAAPSASAEGGDAVGGSNVGYHPRQWNNQNSCWGTASDLRTLISAMHAKGVKVIADIVINHRAGDTGWGNFTKDDFGTYGTYQLTTDHICANDEINTDKSAGAWYGKAKGLMIRAIIEWRTRLRPHITLRATRC